MLTSKLLKDVVSEARPIIERMLDDAERIAGFRDLVSANGGDWGALKALLKAQIQDERDEAGDGKRVRKILEKADYSTSYADMLGWSNMNEDNFSAPQDRDARRRQRFSEGMDDAKALSAEAAALGLIDPKAHAETVRLTNALAEKFGNGPLPEHDAGGVITEPTSSIPETQYAEQAGGADAIPPASASYSETQESPSNRDASTDGEASPMAGPQAEAIPGREQVTGTLAGHEGRSEGEAGSPGLPANSADEPVAEQRPTNPHCLKAQSGEACKFSHVNYTCAACASVAMAEKRRVA